MWLNIYFLIGICYMITNCYLESDNTRANIYEGFKDRGWKWYYHTPKTMLVLLCVVFFVALWPLAMGYQAYQDIRFWLNIKD